MYDVLRRYLEYSGIVVDHVSDVTDIDDKIIARANEEHRRPEEIADQYEAEWVDALYWDASCQRRSRTPSRRWWKPSPGSWRDRAYETVDGVYFAVATVYYYGLLADQSLASLRSGARGRGE